MVNSAEETAKDVYRVLTKLDLLAAETAQPRHRFEATGDPASFAKLGRRFLGPELQRAARAETDARDVA